MIWFLAVEQVGVKDRSNQSRLFAKRFREGKKFPAKHSCQSFLFFLSQDVDKKIFSNEGLHMSGNCKVQFEASESCKRYFEN